MKYWSRKKIVGGSAPKSVTRIGLDLLDAIEPHGTEWPQLLRIGRHDSDDDIHRYEVDVELAPGLILPMEYGLREEEGSEWNDPSNDEEEVFSWTMEGAGCYREDGFAWQADAVSVSADVELRRDLATAVGRPVTELIEHPFLSPDMAVLKAEWSHNYKGDRWLEIKLAMPWRLFCSTTGRVWDADEADVAVDRGCGGGNVVPFGRRRA